QTHALGPESVADVHVALDEALSNVVRHGFADGEEHEIMVVLTLAVDELRMAIEDDGHSFNPLTAPRADLDSPLEERRVGGVGVYLILELMDHVHYERVNGRNRLVMVKRLRRGVGRWMTLDGETGGAVAVARPPSRPLPRRGAPRLDARVCLRAPDDRHRGTAGVVHVAGEEQVRLARGLRYDDQWHAV